MATVASASIVDASVSIRPARNRQNERKERKDRNSTQEKEHGSKRKLAAQSSGLSLSQSRPQAVQERRFFPSENEPGADRIGFQLAGTGFPSPSRISSSASSSPSSSSSSCATLIGFWGLVRVLLVVLARMRFLSSADTVVFLPASTCWFRSLESENASQRGTTQVFAASGGRSMRKGEWLSRCQVRADLCILLQPLFLSSSCTFLRTLITR